MSDPAVVEAYLGGDVHVRCLKIQALSAKHGLLEAVRQGQLLAGKGRDPRARRRQWRWQDDVAAHASGRAWSGQGGRDFLQRRRRNRSAVHDRAKTGIALVPEGRKLFSANDG